MANIRSEYIKNLAEDKDKLAKKLEETAKNSLKDILQESVNKELRNIISESDDDYEEEEVKPDGTDDTASTDDTNTADSTTDTTPDSDDTKETDSDTPADDADAKGDDTTPASDADADSTGDDDVWNGLEQYKGEDGEYDLTGMDKDDVIKVLKVMTPEDGVRVVKNDNGTVTLSDDETDKEYIIDVDGTLGNEDSTADTNTPSDDDDDDFTIDLEDDDDTTDEGSVVNGQKVNEDNVNLGYTDNYQKKTAMTTPDNHEPANSRDTYSMDGGVPTGTEKPYAGPKGKGHPYDQKVNEENQDECGDVNVNETMTSTENSANARNDGMTHANTNSKGKQFRNSSEGGQKVKGTGENSYSGAQVESIKRKANEIFRENKQLRQIAEAIKGKLEEAIVVNSSLGNIIKLVTENSTTKQEKVDIVKRFDKVKTINEGKELYNTISEELKKAGKVNNTSEKTLDNQLTEAKKQKQQKIEETTMYQSADLADTISLMERLNRIK